MSDRDILIVDDDPLALRLLVSALRNEPYRTLACSDSKEALALLRSRQMSLIVADIDMPDNDGVDLMTFVHQRQPDCPVILVSALDPLPRIPAARAVLAKPIDPAHLRQLIAAHLHVGPAPCRT